MDRHFMPDGVHRMTMRYDRPSTGVASSERPREVRIEPGQSKQHVPDPQHEQKQTPWEALIGGSIELRVLDALARFPDQWFTKVDLAEAAGASRGSVDRVINRFETWHVVHIPKRIGQIAVYQANLDNLIVQGFTQFNSLASQQFAQLAREDAKGTKK